MYKCMYVFIYIYMCPRTSLSLELSDARVYEPQIRARLGTNSWPSEPELRSHWTFLSPHAEITWLGI